MAMVQFMSWFYIFDFMNMLEIEVYGWWILVWYELIALVISAVVAPVMVPTSLSVIACRDYGRLDRS